jgi:two-component system CheB/CheR fusion protein
VTSHIFTFHGKRCIARTTGVRDGGEGSPATPSAVSLFNRQIGVQDGDGVSMGREIGKASVDEAKAPPDPAWLETELRLVQERLQSVEAELDISERRFGGAQQLSGVGVWEWNLDTEVTWWSPVVYQLWGLPSGDEPPPLPERRIHSQDRATYLAAREKAREAGELNVEWRVLMPDGSVRWLAGTGRLERSGAGRRMLGVVQDVTRRKEAETRLTMLLGELQHRVRNILGVVRSVVARTMRSSQSIEELAISLDGRLDTLARTQSVFTRSGVASIDLEDVIRDELVAVAAREEQLDIDGPSLRLRREAAEALALALHELTTNAVKYGALSDPNGRLAVRWIVTNTNTGRRLALEWRESGVRAVDLKPSRSGFGRELIERGLPYELGASTSLEFARGGVKATIELPLTDRIADLDAREEETGA